HRVDVLVGGDVEGLPHRHAHETAVELEVDRRVLHLGQRDLLGFPGLADLECGEPRCVGPDRACKVDEQPAAVECGDPQPLRARCGSSAHGRTDVDGIAPGDTPDGTAG